MATNTGPSPIELDTINKVIEAVAEQGLVASYDKRRRAIQLAVEADRGQEALFAATLRWRDAARDAGLPPWDMLRVDVIRGSAPAP